MNEYFDILECLKKNDLIFAESLIGLLKHKTDLKLTFQTNYLDLVEKKSNKFFFKLYLFNNNEWQFFDYGWLNIINSETFLNIDNVDILRKLIPEGDNNSKIGLFYTNKSKILIFNVPDIYFCMERRHDSLNHVVVNYNGVIYLLYNPFIKVIDMLFK